MELEDRWCKWVGFQEVHYHGRIRNNLIAEVNTA